MGFYWASFLYYGRLCSPEAHDRLIAHGAPKEFIKQLTNDRWMLYVPGRMFQVGVLDPVLEDHEKHSGRVEMKEVERWFKQRPEMRESWYSVAAKDQRKLGQLVKVAADGNEDEKPATPRHTSVRWPGRHSTMT